MKFVLLIFIIALFASCFDQGDCLVSASNLLHVQFKKESNNTLDTAMLLTKIFYLEANAYQNFSLDTPNAELLIPIDIKRSVTTFVFQHSSSLDTSQRYNDTLKIGYTSQSKVISPNCGAFTYYQDLKILHSSLESSRIKILSTSLIKDPTTSGISAYALNYQLFY